MKRALTYIVVNGLYTASGIYGYIYGLNWAQNIFMFITWSMIILGLLTSLLLAVATIAIKIALENDDSEKIRKSKEDFDNALKKTLLPNWAYTIDVLYDLSMIFFIAAIGHPIAAILYAIIMIIHYFRRNVIIIASKQAQLVG